LRVLKQRDGWTPIAALILLQPPTTH